MLFQKLELGNCKFYHLIEFVGFKGLEYASYLCLFLLLICTHAWTYWVLNSYSHPPCHYMSFQKLELLENCELNLLIEFLGFKGLEYVSHLCLFLLLICTYAWTYWVLTHDFILHSIIWGGGSATWAWAQLPVGTCHLRNIYLSMIGFE